MDTGELLAHRKQHWAITGPAKVGIELSEGDWLAIGQVDLSRLLVELFED